MSSLTFPYADQFDNQTLSDEGDTPLKEEEEEKVYVENVVGN